MTPIPEVQPTAVEVEKASIENAPSEAVTPVRRSIPGPGRVLSFEEALALTMSKYDNALRELAK